MIRLLVPLGVAISIAARCLAQTPPATAQPKAPAAAPATAPGAVRPIPPPGIEVPAADRAEIEAGLKELAAKIEQIRKTDAKSELPNVEIFYKSADWALRYNEIFDAKQIATAKDHVKQGLERVAALEKGQKPWDSATGLVVRGYRSQIDDSVQPYGLVIPADAKPGDNKKRPLHFWCHGRGEKLSELAFIAERQKSPGEFVPEGAIVCHLYGRYCNANKFAGERDLFEALYDIGKNYAIDDRRLVIRGFSMGGAACWQFATHFPGMWAAAAPGAGFAETAEFFKVFAPGKEAPPTWEQKLWGWYDCTTMAANLANTTTVAYSGEIDGQKQAADIMLKYAEKEGVTFPHIIGPQTAHKYHPESKPKINEIVDAAVARGNDPQPKEVRFVTHSLIYPKAHWVSLHRLEKQWERAEIQAKLTDADILEITTGNVAKFACMIKCKGVVIDGQKAQIDEKAYAVIFEKADKNWRITPLFTSDPPSGDAWNWRHKKDSNLCGPIDHAFMSKFVFVRPTGKPMNETVGAWVKSEMERAIREWRRVFRGDVLVLDDTDWMERKLNDDLIEAHAVLWGDSSSNKALAALIKEDAQSKKLPLEWDAKTLQLRSIKVDPAHHVPILIYPNPANPSKYVVLNSGFTFREAAALNNSDQTPKLPDWALVDLRTPPGPKWPGKIVEAGFFDEEWK